VRGSRSPMRLDPHWSPEPDLLVVRGERRHLMTLQRLDGPADMVIEIASESDPTLDAREKLPRYRAAGIDGIWLVDPFTQRLRADTRRAGPYHTAVLSEGRLEALVLPGFWIDVAWLWWAPLPASMQCLRAIAG
jgi:Uma2 family endonuclease